MHQLFRVNPHRDYGDSEIQSPWIAICCVLNCVVIFWPTIWEARTCRCGIQTPHCWLSGFKYIASVFLLFFDTPGTQKKNSWHRNIIRIPKLCQIHALALHARKTIESYNMYHLAPPHRLPLPPREKESAVTAAAASRERVPLPWVERERTITTANMREERVPSPRVERECRCRE